MTLNDGNASHFFDCVAKKKFLNQLSICMNRSRYGIRAIDFQDTHGH